MGCVGKRSEVIGFAGAAEAGVEDWEPLSALSLPLSFLPTFPILVPSSCAHITLMELLCEYTLLHLIIYMSVIFS